MGQAGVGQVGGSDQRGPGIVGIAEQVGLAVQEPFNKPPHLHLGPPQPHIEVRELGGPRRWEPSQVPILAQPLKRPFEMWQRRGRTQTRSRSRSQQQPHPPPVGDTNRQMVKPPKIHIPRSNRQPILDWVIPDQKRESISMAGLGVVNE